MSVTTPVEISRRVHRYSALTDRQAATRRRRREDTLTYCDANDFVRDVMPTMSRVNEGLPKIMERGVRKSVQEEKIGYLLVQSTAC